jgi:hypothetical protein
MSTITSGVTVPTALTFSGDTTGAITFQVSGTVTAATITSAGNVGIGTASPGAKLQIQSGTSPTQPTWAASDVVIAGNSTGNSAFYQSFSDTGGGLVFSTPTTRARSFLLWNENNGNSTWQNGSSGALVLNTNGAERMRVGGDGNVGIGTASPNAKTEIYGTAAANNLALRITNTATDGYSTLQLGGSGDAGIYRNGSAQGLYGGNNSLNLITTGAHPIGFSTSNTLRMLIDSSGNVGIGTTPSSNVRLDIYAGTSAAGSYCVAFRNSSATNLFYIENHGTIFTGSAANSPYNLTTGSAANVFVDSGGALYRSTSSLRYKSDITNAEHGLADVLKLRSVTYKAKNSGDTVFGGLIAEEVHDAGLTEFVSYNKEGRPDAIHYGNMVALLTKAMQEQQAIIDELKAKVAALETK